MIICNTCGKVIKNLSEHGNQGKCKICYNEYMARYRSENRKKINEYSRDWRRDKRWLDGRGNYGYDK